MSELTREIRFRNGYDYRDTPQDGRGAHGAELHFIYRGQLGAIVAVISTGWMHRPLRGSYLRLDPPQPQARRDKPGVDATLRDQYPTGSYIALHSPTQRQDWWWGPTPCDILGGTCYGDKGYTVADTFLDRLLLDQEQAWAYLAEIHDSWTRQ